MTYKEAIDFINNEIQIDVALCSDEKVDKTIESLKLAIYALEKQIPEKPYKRKEHKQNNYYCIVCKRYLGDDMELKYACLQPKYCEHCGQALDWSDTE